MLHYAQIKLIFGNYFMYLKKISTTAHGELHIPFIVKRAHSEIHITFKKILAKQPKVK
jgi:hypothetical protein